MDFDALWDYNDPAKTEALFRQQLTQEMTVSQRAQLLTQIARTHSLRSQFAEAHAILDEAKPLLPEAGVLVQVRYSLERGRTHNSAKEKETAVTFFKSAYEQSCETEHDYHTIDALHMLAIAEPEMEAQLKWSGLAIEWCEKTADERAKKWLGPLYNNTGWTHHDMGQYEKALALFEKGVAWRAAFPDNPKPLIIAKWSVGHALRSLGRLDEALAQQQTLWQEYIDEDVWRGYIAEEIAECLLALGQETGDLFCIAHQYLSLDNWLVTHEVERLARLEQQCQNV